MTGHTYTVQTQTKASILSAGVIAVLVISLALAPLFASRSTLQDLFFILTMLSLAQLWNLLAGFGGLVSVGQQAFVGMGAYVFFGAVGLWDMPLLPAVLLGGIAAIVLAIPTAFFAFRLQGAYFAIATWVIAEVTRLSVAMWKQLGGGTGTTLPRDLREGPFVSWIAERLDLRTSAAMDVVTYWLALALTVAIILGLYRLLRSRNGLALAAVRDNAEAAKSVGVGAPVLKWMVFLIAAFGTGLTGALIYLQKGRISPDAAFSVVDWTAYVIFIVVIGGIGTIEGPILGVLILFTLQSLFADFGSWYLMLVGAIAIAVMLFAPRGIWGLVADKTGLQLFPIRRRLLSDKN